MELKIQNLIKRTIFVDTNAFIYFLTGICNELTQELFKLSYLGKIKLLSSTRIVDELLFKMMLLRAKERFGLNRKVLRNLRQNKKRVAELSSDCQKILDFLDTAKIKILEIRKSTMKAIPKVMRTNGLFGNDALSLKLIKENNVKYILTSDPDFEDIEGLEIIYPLEKDIRK